MIGNIIFLFVFVPIVFALMIFFHEIGHAMVLKKYVKGKIPIKWGFNSSETGTQEQINQLNLKEYKKVLLGGILMGIIPLFLLQDVFYTYVNFTLFFGYLWTSGSDIKQLFRKKG